MRIEQIELVWAAMPLLHPWKTAFGDDDTVESVFVRLSSGSLDGWGESASWKYPAYSPECASAQFLISRDFLAPLLLGQDISSGEELQRRFSGIKGNPFAKAGFDLGWWDLYAKSLDKPLWQVLGGTDPVVDAGTAFGVGLSIEALLDSIRAAVDEGYKRVKLKYRPGWDLEMVAAVRDAFPDLVMHIDCNSAYSLDDVAMFKALDRYGLAMIEQPLAYDDLIDHAALQASIETPVCLDESITSPDKARKAVQIGAGRWVNIKHGRAGGITNALAINRICEDAGIPCWIGSMIESALGESYSVALATLPNMKYPSDILPSGRFYARDCALPPLKHSAPSQFRASMSPGVGAYPDPDALEDFALDRVVLKA